MARYFKMLVGGMWIIFQIMGFGELWALPSEFSPQAKAAQQKHSTVALIDQAYAAKQITIDQWALFQCYALFDQQKLPVQYQSSVREKCGTWII